LRVKRAPGTLKPEAKKRKRMTLITSMRAKYGAIILADSQETVRDHFGDEYKYSIPKSEPESVRGFHYVIAGGGDGDAIDELNEKFRRSLARSNCLTLDGFRTIFERHLKAELRSIQKEKGRIEVIVAVAKNGKWEVWRNAWHTLVSTLSDIPMLVGFDADIYKHIASELFPHAASTAQIVLVGLRILELARQSSTCVSPPYLGVIVVPGGILPLSQEVLSELTESMAIFRGILDRLLLACGDTSLGTKEFGTLMEECKRHAFQMRADYLQSVAEKDFLSEWRTGIPSGIPLLPPGSIRTASLGSSGMITVKVEDTSERKK
jgi:hypothetical protein